MLWHLMFFRYGVVFLIMFHIFHCYWKTCQKVQSQTSVHWRPACLFYWHDFYGNRKINVGSYTFFLVSRNHVFNTFYNALPNSCPLSRNWLRKYQILKHIMYLSIFIFYIKNLILLSFFSILRKIEIKQMKKRTKMV